MREIKTVEDVLEYIADLDKKFNEYLIELEDEEGVYFTVSKEKDTGIYYFTLLETDGTHLRKAHREFRHFMEHLHYDIKEDSIKVNLLNEVKPITINDIYDITSLTSADTLEELYAKFDFVFKSFK